MFEGKGTYYEEYNKYEGSKVTSIPKLSEQLSLDIEIYSEEEGMGFEEHYIISDGEVLKEECFDLVKVQCEGTDDYECYSPVPWVFTI